MSVHESSAEVVLPSTTNEAVFRVPWCSIVKVVTGGARLVAEEEQLVSESLLMLLLLELFRLELFLL